MLKSILDSLYYGKIKPLEMADAICPKYKEINRKIEDEKRYFMEKMSLDDVQRFEALERLYIQAAECEQIAAFTKGFRIGARIMLETLQEGSNG